MSGTASRRFASAQPQQTVAIDPFGDMSALAPAAGCSSTIRRSRAWRRDLLLVTHEHIDHNGVEAIGGEPTILRSTAGKLESPVGEVTAIASEHDEPPAPSAGPNTIFVFELDGLRVCHFGDFGQSALRDEQAAAIGDDRPADLARRRRSHDRRRAGRAIVERLPPRWVVPMHYRTPRIGFLETADAFLERAEPRRAPRADDVRDRRTPRAGRAAGGGAGVTLVSARGRRSALVSHHTNVRFLDRRTCVEGLILDTWHFPVAPLE